MYVHMYLHNYLHVIYDIQCMHVLSSCMNYCGVLWYISFCDHSSKVPSVTNQLAGHNEGVGQFAIPSQTGTIQAPHNEEPVPKNEEPVPKNEKPVPKNEEPVPNNDEPVTSVINEMYEDRVIPDGYAVVDTEDVREL